MSSVVVQPATSDRWLDVIVLLGGDGERGCWCQSWRGSDASFGGAPAGGNRERLKVQMEDGPFAPGLIAYRDDEPVGWCGLGPRLAMPRLVHSRTIPVVDDLPVWSIGCFKIRVGYRRQGVARALLAAAIEHARKQGAPALEAYPIDPEGRRVDVGFGYVGFTSMFEAQGFRRVTRTDAHSAGRPRWLMRLDLESGQDAPARGRGATRPKASESGSRVSARSRRSR
jgi:GNAT superfamily N-acetyltransferase